MEDCLVSAQEGRLYLQPEHIDALLQGTDMLMRIATPGSANVGPVDVEAYLLLMKTLLDPSASSARMAPPSQPAAAKPALEAPAPAIGVVEPVVLCRTSAPPPRAASGCCGLPPNV